jgi:uroporphyrinogen decarboxylase
LRVATNNGASFVNKRERVMAAIAGRAVDRVPLSFWLHNFAREHSAEALADETLRLYRTFDWDFLKPQSRYQCFAEMWGLEYRVSADRAEWPTITRLPVLRPEAFGELAPKDPDTGALAEQIDALRRIRANAGPDVPMVATVFSPLMVAQFMLPGGIDGLFALMREHPDALERGLEAIATTLEGYVRLLLREGNGIDGIFYATNVATRDRLSAADFHRFQARFDGRILAAAESATFNILHMCGSGILFDEFVHYPVHVFSWATSAGNPSLSEVHRRTGRAVLGGLPAKPVIKSMSAQALVDRADAALAETGGRFHLLGPDCSINPDTPEDLLHAVGEHVRRDDRRTGTRGS